MPVSKTKIEWSDATWSPTTGCTMVSQGCKNCYAQALTHRYAGRPGWPAEFLPWTPANAAQNVVLHPDRLAAPFSWKTPRRVFVNSMSDLFHEEIPDEFIDKVFAVMALTPQHTYQVLTKRPERMRGYLKDSYFRSEMVGISAEYRSGIDRYIDDERPRWPFPLPNVWLGVTVENQRWADERIPILLDTPAAVRFLSCEPMLGPIDIMRGYQWARGAVVEPYVPPLQWVIVGGESGSGHRPFDPDWARALVDQCRHNNIAAFVKQMGGARPGNRIEDLPADLQVRQFPL